MNCLTCHLNDDQDHSVCELLSEAHNKINTGQTEKAIWRLIEAAGLLGKKFPNAEGISSPTENGFRLIQS